MSSLQVKPRALIEVCGKCYEKPRYQGTGFELLIVHSDFIVGIPGSIPTALEQSRRLQPPLGQGRKQSGRGPMLVDDRK